ncbi:MAG: type II secretion system protein [Candidatus Paceibacterota bacterium]|jgi:prepilin-type N-terminal cleavage/methylation domain-containing protein
MKFSVVNILKIKNSGFTLVEIVVVIGIMALLSTIIFTSFDGAKAKSRDQQRIADISTIQLALEIFFNKNKEYPKELSTLQEDGTFNIPTAPNNSDGYGYYYFPIERIQGSDRCVSYHLWTKFENKSSFLDSKKSFNSDSLDGLYECGGDTSATGIDASSDDLIYDVTP